MLDIQYITTKTPYADALAMQEEAVAKVLAGKEETIFMAEHSPIFTMGTSAKESDLLNVGNIPVVKTGRGGQVTYHGPGQRIIYPILNLKTRKQDLRWYVRQLQNIIVETLAELGVEGHITDDVGVWVKTPSGMAKIAAIGIRVRKWVTFHGLALNINPDLQNYTKIIPCGMAGSGVTSLEALGVKTTMEEIDKILLTAFENSELKSAK